MRCCAAGVATAATVRRVVPGGAAQRVVANSAAQASRNAGTEINVAEVQFECYVRRELLYLRMPR